MRCRFGCRLALQTVSRYSTQSEINASCDLWTMHGTIVIISVWRTQARRLPGAYMDAFKAQSELVRHSLAQFELRHPPNPPALPSLASQSEVGWLRWRHSRVQRVVKGKGSCSFRDNENLIFYTDTGSVGAEERSASGSRLRQVGSTSSACHSPTTT